MRTTTRQANFTLPADLLEDLKRTVPRGEQSRVVGEALRNELKRIKFRMAVEESFGAWKAGRHSEPGGGIRRFIRSLRGSARLARVRQR